MKSKRRPLIAVNCFNAVTKIMKLEVTALNDTLPDLLCKCYSINLILISASKHALKCMNPTLVSGQQPNCVANKKYVVT